MAATLDPESSLPARSQIPNPEAVLGQFLDFLAYDIASNPAQRQPLVANLVARAKRLVAGIEPDLNAARCPNDE